jgi:predicted transcriptional regulator
MENENSPDRQLATFRLTAEARTQMEALARHLGTSKTAVLEIAIRQMTAAHETEQHRNAESLRGLNAVHSAARKVGLG